MTNINHAIDEMSDGEFVKAEGSKCPTCKSEDVLPDRDFGLRRDHFYYGMRCKTCSEQWDEIYKLSGWNYPITYTI